MASISDLLNSVTLREREELDKALLPGEVARWAARPFPQFWCAETAILFAGGIFGLLFMAFWTFGALGMPTSAADLENIDGFQYMFASFSLPFWVMDLYLLTRPWQRMRRLRHTLYVITNRRAVVVEPGLFSWKSYAYPLAKGMVLSRRSGAQGRGDLVFAEERRSNDGPAVRRGFICLADLREAEHKLYEAIDACESTGATGAGESPGVR